MSPRSGNSPCARKHFTAMWSKSAASLCRCPCVREWLQQLSDAGIPCVVGSSTHRINIETSLEIIHLREYFADIVSAEDVTHGKPAPDVFLKAAAKIHRDPNVCVVFEDAHVGIQAARNAGMKVVGVATTNPLADLGEAGCAVKRLDELTVAQLDGWFLKSWLCPKAPAFHSSKRANHPCFPAFSCLSLT